jgi:hypothetical protein
MNPEPNSDIYDTPEDSKFLTVIGIMMGLAGTIGALVILFCL